MAFHPDLPAYLSRLGRPDISGGPSLDTLQRLVLHHAQAIPFENLNPFAGLPVSLALRDIERRWYHWGLEYVTYTLGDRGKKQKPGEGSCPGGRCVICWEYGADEMTDERYKRWCRWCGDWKSQHGEKPVRPIWEVHRQGRRVNTGHLRQFAPHLLPKERSA